MRQLMKSIGALAALRCWPSGISSVAAHHSAAMFDLSKTMTMKGSVVELRWVNPHVTLTAQRLTQRGRSAGRLADGNDQPRKSGAGRGWRRDAVKPGDQVEVVFNPLRDADKKERPDETAHGACDRRSVHRQYPRAGKRPDLR